MVVRRLIGRALSVTGVLATTVALATVTSATVSLTTGVALAAGGAPVAAPPAAVTVANALPVRAPAAPTTLHITGKFTEDKLIVKAEEDADKFKRLLAEVNWLAAARPNTTAPKVNKLGPKFTLTVLVKDSPQQVYDMYPLAAGGPRAYRPAKQPNNKKVTAGWFYGRLSMSESLRLNGVPLAEKRDSVSGGIGGGERIDLGEDMDPTEGVSQFLGELRQLVLLNGAVVLTIALGLAGISFLIRRKV